MTNILFVLNLYPGFGGIETVTNILVEWLSRYYNVHTVSFTGQKEAPLPKAIAGHHIFPSEVPAENVAFYNQLVEQLNPAVVFNQGMFLNIAEVVFNEQRDRSVPVVSCLHGMPGYERFNFWNLPFVMSASPRSRRRWAWKQKLGICRHYNNYLDLFRNRYTAMYRSSAAVVVLCEPYISEFSRFCRLDDGGARVIAIPNPLPPRFGNVKVAAWKDRRNEVLFVGRLSEEKRVDLLIKLWMQVKNRRGWKLVIVGDGDRRNELKSLTSSLGLEDVEFAGATDAPERYYAKAKYVVLTSKFEGFGMCLIEGMAYGDIPMAFNVSSGLKSIIDHSGGRLIGNGKDRRFVRALSQAIHSNKNRDKESKKAYDKANMYDVDRIGPQWRELIERVSKQKNEGNFIK